MRKKLCLTIDYGASSIYADGRVLQGKISVQQSDEIFSSGAVWTITYDDFFIDGIQLVGKSIHSLNYGNGSCDRFGKVTMQDGNSFTVRFRR